MKKVKFKRVMFDEILLNDIWEDEMVLILDSRRITLHKKFVENNSIELVDGDGPEGYMNISEGWLTQNGLYHMVDEI